MSLLSKLKEARIGIAAGRVTVDSPAQARPAPAGFRGRPVFDVRRCIGCGGCASNCPARAILVLDPCQEVRVLQYVGRRCAYCGRCADVCPERAVTMSPEWETATDDAADLQQRLEIFMSTCQRCGRCFPPPSALETLKLHGYRADDLVSERWVPRARTFQEGAPETDDVPIDVEG